MNDDAGVNLPSADDVLGIWKHPEGTDYVPCVCCGTCTCDFHGGEVHHDQRWCFICVGRGHHESDPKATSPGALDPTLAALHAEQDHEQRILDDATRPDPE